MGWGVSLSILLMIGEMHMRNVFIGSVSAAVLMFSGAAMAAPPTAFGAWTVDSAGVIGGAGCTGGIVGTGFLQCQVVINNKTYIQTIIAEGFGATGATLDRLTFRSQDFVQIGAGAPSGVASTVAIKDTVTNPGTTFTTSADILAGWAVATGSTNKSEAVLKVGLDAPGAAGANKAFLSTFNVTAITTSANANIISELGMGQTVGLEGNAGSTDRQRFELRNKAANPAVTAYTVGGTGPTPGTGVVTATAGTAIQGLWIGQTVTGSDAFSVQRLSTMSAAGDPLTTTTRTALGSTAPVDWGTGGVFTAQFGTAPTF